MALAGSVLVSVQLGLYMSRLIVTLLFSPAVAIAQGQLPSDIDLKAAYCIPIARFASQTTVMENLPESFRKSLRDTKDRGDVNLRRLNLYLVPRLSQLDVMSLVGAAKSAEEDLGRVNAEMKLCDSISPVEEALKCMAVETEAVKRVRSCNVLSFLPF